MVPQAKQSGLSLVSIYKKKAMPGKDGLIILR